MSIPNIEPVVSSNAKGVGYDAENEHLYIEFKNGSIYRYLGVSAETHSALMSAPSIGKFLHSEIINQFNHERVQ